MENKFVKILVLVCLPAACATQLGFGAKAQKSPPRITAEAQWQPGMSFIVQVHKACAKVEYPAFQSCYFEQMVKAGAPRQAVTFSRWLLKQNSGLLGFMRDFRAAGHVDVAYVFCPFRANENEVWLLINGSPPMLDVDDLRLLSQNQLKQNPVYQKLAQHYPKIDLWPGDRSGTSGPLAKNSAGGAQQFLVSYYLQNGCHACARLGSARFVFYFDRAGRFSGAKLRKVIASSSQ